MIAGLEAYRAGLLAPRHWTRNIVSGLLVGIVALPLGLAFAIASGVRPEQGIYTAIVAGAAVSVLGGSRVQIAGPTGAFIVILADVVARHGAEGLMVATLMAGAILVAMGLARLGRAVSFIPDPVIAGFTAGIGIVIWVGQWHDFFGLPPTGGARFHDKLWQLLLALPRLDPATTAMALASMALVILGPRLPGLRRVPGPLIALVAATAVQAAFALPSVATIGSAFGGIPLGLPPLVMPHATLDRILELVPSAFTIAMLGAIESLLSAVVADGMVGTRHDANQELVGQGIANILCPLFGGIAATGAIARTATNCRNGANSPIAGLVHALVLVLVLLVLAPLAGRIPLCALAAILFVVAWNMSGARHVVAMLRTAPPADAVILLITLALTVFTDLVVAVNIGVILAMLQFLRRMSGAVTVLDQDEAACGHPLAPDMRVYAIEGPLFFGVVDALERSLGQIPAATRIVALRLARVPFVDATGIRALQATIAELERRGTRVVLCEANARVLRKLLRAGVVPRSGPRRYRASLSRALASPAPA